MGTQGLPRQWIISIQAKIRISLLAPALTYPTVPTSAAQEAAALPIRPVVTNVMSPHSFCGQ